MRILPKKLIINKQHITKVQLIVKHNAHFHKVKNGQKNSKKNPIKKRLQRDLTLTSNRLTLPKALKLLSLKNSKTPHLNLSIYQSK